jgi:hypothetical protein
MPVKPSNASARTWTAVAAAGEAAPLEFVSRTRCHLIRFMKRMERMKRTCQTNARPAGIGFAPIASARTGPQQLVIVIGERPLPTQTRYFMSANPHWQALRPHLTGCAILLYVYSVVVLSCGTSYPSVRFANPERIGPNWLSAGSGEIYQGARAVFGWPLEFLSWREEAELPISSGERSRMRIVAVSLSWLALGLNLTAVLAVYALVASVWQLGQRRSWQGLLIAAVSVAFLIPGHIPEANSSLSGRCWMIVRTPRSNIVPPGMSSSTCSPAPLRRFCGHR